MGASDRVSEPKEPVRRGAEGTPASLWAYVRPYWGRLAVGIFLLLATNATEKAIPWFFQHALDSLHGGALEVVKWYALGVVGLAAVSWLVRTLSRVWIFNIGRDIEYDLRNEVLERIHLLGTSFFRKIAT